MTAVTLSWFFKLDEPSCYNTPYVEHFGILKRGKIAYYAPRGSTHQYGNKTSSRMLLDNNRKRYDVGEHEKRVEGRREVSFLNAFRVFHTS